MTITPKFLGNVNKGKMTLEQPNEFLAYLHSLQGRVEIIVKKFKKQRSIPENSYFHGVVIPLLADELGYTHQEMKGIIKWVFKVKSTADLDTVAFEDLMVKVRQWASVEFKFYIPLPNECDY